MKFLSVKPFTTCQLFPAGTLTGTLEKPIHVHKLVFTQEFVQFSWRHGLEGLIGGSKDCVDPFPVEHLRQPCSLDGGYQHSVDTRTERVTFPHIPRHCGQGEPGALGFTFHCLQKKGRFSLFLLS